MRMLLMPIAIIAKATTAPMPISVIHASSGVITSTVAWMAEQHNAFKRARLRFLERSETNRT